VFRERDRGDDVLQPGKKEHRAPIFFFSSILSTSVSVSKSKQRERICMCYQNTPYKYFLFCGKDEIYDLHDEAIRSQVS
jgi:hypothetical protein